MSTISSKSNKKSAPGSKKDRNGPKFSGNAAASASVLYDISDSTFRLAAGAVLILGTILRLYNLTLVPLHHDEGVNGNFLVTLVREGKYIYDPQNYHGPTLYFFSSLIPWLARFFGGVQARDAYGLTTFNIRLITALFGIATIWLALMLRKRLGSIGALSAAVLIGISPGAIYLSRYFIHETLFVFFTLGIIVAALRYYDTAKSVYMILAAISAGLMVATKETWIINGPVLLIALATTQLYFLVRKKLGNRNSSEETSPREMPPQSSLMANVTLIAFAVFIALTILFIASFNEYKNSIWIWISVVCLIGATLYFVLQPKRSDADANAELPTDSALARFGGAVPLTTVALVAFAVFILVNVLFYSSFFTNYPKGVSDALKTLNLWRQRTHEHEHPWWQYAYWLLWEEGILVVLSGFGALIALWRANNRLALFLALWSFGLLAAYSLVGYKTPWISLNFVVPMALTAGYTLQFAYEKLSEYHAAALAPVMAVAIIAFCGYQLYQLNFVHYDDDQLPYVYAHTKREMLTMIDKIESIAQKNGTGTDTGVAIVSPDYWPLPWYFRNYKKVGYYQQIVPTNEPIIIASKAQEEQLTQYSDRYDVIDSGADEGAYPLRPGVDLLLLVRRDVKR
jgi:predicted membrane-bound mannosyltransferase